MDQKLDNTKKPDDVDALRVIIDALSPLPREDQERVIKWTCDKLGLSWSNKYSEERQSISPSHQAPIVNAEERGARPTARDIKSFVTSKAPASDAQFTAVVAYYYAFEAPEDQRKPIITSKDIEDATRKVGRSRILRIPQTMVGAHSQGLLDRVGKGEYKINAVGENLVAITLPGGTATKSKQAKASPKTAPKKHR